MKKNYFFLVAFFLTLFLNCSLYSNAQLKADFTASVTAGCAPFAVQFLDASTGNPNEWIWNFGNGTFSTSQNPAAVFTNPGTYDIRLTVKAGAGQDVIVKNAYIVVYANPQVAFSAFGRNGCVPLDINFSDSSSAGGGSITDWLWDFGDGSASSLQNPSHTYSVVNTFKVSLTVKNTYGCGETLLQNAFVSTRPGIQTDFSYSYNNICTSPADIAFFNNSMSADSLYYQWYFGDGAASTAQDPAHTYSLPGAYNVTLISKGQTSSCRDTAVKSIIIGAPSADFILPKSICLNTPLLFQDSSLPQPLSVRWDFGDGKTANGINVYHTYTNNGTYQVKMTADFGSCTATREKTIVVAGNTQASFIDSGYLKSCILPQSISFTNQSSGAVAYQWNFGDGKFSNNNNPVHLYTAAGNYSVTLIAINANGCADTVTKNNLIRLNPVQINGLQNAPFEGCAPKTINFKPLINTSDPVASYQWSFGDGGSSNLPNPSHYYPYVGSYTVSLIVITQTGCTDTFTSGNAVTLGSRPFIAFKARPLNACASSLVNFTDLSSGIITGWLWDFGDGTGSTDQNPQHQYADTGYYSIKLIVSGNGCLDSLTKINFVHIRPPVANFNFRVDCNDYFTVNFTNTSIGAQTFLWDFGDSSTSILRSPLHRYAKTGSYLVSLTVSNNNGCSYTKDSIVNIITKAEELDYQPDLPDFCKYDTVKFRVTNYNSALVTYFDWNFADGSVTGPTGRTDSIFHVYTAAGNYQPYVIIRNIYACYDTVYSKSTIKVYGPKASFLANPAACRDSLVVFNDLSVPYQNYAITSWSWDFGDGIINTYTSPPFTHVYSSSGIYDVKLKITDSKGCYDTIFLNTIRISRSALDAGADTAICSGDSTTLQPSGADTYTWQASNSLSCTNCINPVADPNITTVYYVSGTNRVGCTSQDSVVVEVKQPFILQLNNNADTLCAGTAATLIASGAELYQWIPSDNSQILYGSSVSISRSSNVTYTVIGTDNAGCFSDTGQIALQVYPDPTISFPDDLVVITAGSQYQIQPMISADVTQLLWTPPIGLSCNTCPSPVAQPRVTTTYTLRANNPGNCSTSADITIQVICKDQQIFIPNTFSPNGDGVNDVFFPRGKGIYTIRSFLVFNRAGQVVFERRNMAANNAADGWNGKYLGRLLNSDVYIYVIEVVCDNNQVIPFKGNVSLLR